MFHRSFNALYKQTIDEEDLQSLISPTENAFVPDCLKQLRTLLKTKYRRVAIFTESTSRSAMDQFLDNTALYTN